MTEDDRDGKKNVSGQFTEPEATGEGAGLSAYAQEEIGRRLRGVYGQLAAEPLPDKFTRLLEQLGQSKAATVRKADQEDRS